MNMSAIRRALTAAIEKSPALRTAARYGGRWVIGSKAGEAGGAAAGGAYGYFTADKDATRAGRLKRAAIGAAIGFNAGGVSGGSAAIGPALLRDLRAGARRVKRFGNAGPISALRRKPA